MKDLKDAFVEDHRTLISGLKGLLELVDEGDYGDASKLAKELDAAAGPHIEFEEKCFYPEVGKSRSRDYVSNLYDEHRSGMEAVRTLSSLEAGSVLSSDERERVLFHLQRALDHAVSCGTLLSHVTSLAEPEQKQLLDELERYRSLAHKWTDLHRDGE